MKNTVFIDFESYYSSADNYTLKKISMVEYIRSKKFKVFGAGISFNGKNAVWYNASVLRQVFEQIDWTNVTLVAHNVKFDGAILRWIYGINPKRYADTLSMARAVIGCRLASHSLANCAGYYGLAPKGFLQTDGLKELTLQQETELATYCKHDVELCLQIYNKLAEDFPEGQYDVMDWTIRCFIDSKLVLDGPKLEKLHAEEKQRRAQIFAEIGIEKSIFSSNAKFAKLLAERGYECPVKKSVKTGKQIPALSVSDTGFIELQCNADPELEALCEARIAAKSNLLETRSLKFLEVSKLGTFPFDLNFSGAVNTHRFSGANGAGGNPQNLPRGSALRGAISAPELHKLLVADFAAIELRIVAWLAREPKLIEVLMDRKGDPYCQFATKIYGKEITKADKKERQYGKCAVLGLGYNMGPKKFIFQARSQTGMIIEQDEAERVVALYRSYYNRVPELWQRLEQYIPYIANGTTVKIPGIPFLEIKKHCVYLPSGLRLQYPKLRQVQEGRHLEWIFDAKGDTMKLYGGKLLENISQALAGELCKLAITRAVDAGVNCVGQVHDEVLGVAAADQAADTAQLLVDIMETTVPWWPTLKLYAEGGYGNNWLEAKK